MGKIKTKRKTEKKRKLENRTSPKQTPRTGICAQQMERGKHEKSLKRTDKDENQESFHGLILGIELQIVRVLQWNPIHIGVGLHK
jgi:hypothetical protein